MRIDAHQHFWRYNPAEYDWIDDSMASLRRDFLPADLRMEIDRAAIDACIAVQARQSIEETRWLLDLADRHPFIAGVVGWIDLQADEVAAQLGEFAARSKLIGVRHIVQSEPDDRFMQRPAFRRGIAQLADFDLTYDILIYPKHLASAAELVAQFPRQRFVLDHLAKPDIRAGEMSEWERGIRTLAGFPHVFCKVSGLVTEADWMRWTPKDLTPYLDVAFDAFGANRLMAGSDWPVCTVATDYSQVIGVLDEYLNARPPVERGAVMGGNAERFWNLEARWAKRRTGELV